MVQHDANPPRQQEKQGFSYLTGQFLLAMPSVEAGVFSGSVVYLFEHTPEGAAGVIINRVTDIELGDLIERLELEASDDVAQQWVHFGGPVQAMSAFLFYADDSSDSGEVELKLADTRELLEEYLQGHGPQQAFVCFGYAGWDAGQLEDELKQNVWLTVPSGADSDLIFKHPVHDRYRAALARLGIDLANLSSQVGHA